MKTTEALVIPAKGAALLKEGLEISAMRLQSSQVPTGATLCLGAPTMLVLILLIASGTSVDRMLLKKKSQWSRLAAGGIRLIWRLFGHCVPNICSERFEEGVPQPGMLGSHAPSCLAPLS